MFDNIIGISDFLSGYRQRLNILHKTPHSIYSLEEYSTGRNLCPSTLYYLEYKNIHTIKADNVTDISFLILNTESVSASPKNINAIFVSRGYNTEDIITLIRNHIADQHILLEFTNKLFYVHAKKHHNVQEIMDMAFEFIGNPIALYDAAFNLISVSGNASDVEFGDKIIENGYLDAQHMKFLNTTKIHDTVLNSDNPCLIKAYANDKLAIRINSVHGNIGHIIISAINKPLQSIDYKLLRLLRDAIYQQWEHSDFVKNQYNSQMDFLIHDLLTGRIKTREHFQTRNNNLFYPFPMNHLSCTVIDLSLAQQHLSTRQLMSDLMPIAPNSYSVQFQKYVVILTTADDLDHNVIEGLRAKIHDLCRESTLYAGQSNCFHDLFHLSHYFKQAITAIQLNYSAQKSPGLFHYYDIAKQHFISAFVKNKDFKYHCHPAALTLLEYDQKKNTCLSESLYEYLACERNAKLTASRLYIHRNTLNYRLESINSLLNLDLDDPYTREYLLISFWCLKYLDTK